MSHLQCSKLLLFIMVALTHYPFICRTFSAIFYSPFPMEVKSE